MNLSPEVQSAVDGLTRWARQISSETDGLSNEAALQLERNLGGKSSLRRAAAMVGVDNLSREFLAKNSWAVGAGVLLAGDLVEDGGRALEWWIRARNGAVNRLEFDVNPGSSRYYDYEKLPFFSIPAETGEQAMWGPYIDYLGVEEYILTFAAPVFLRGEFAGVAGCDICIKDLEPLLMPELRAIPSHAALVNVSDRIILGNSGMYLVGERIRSGRRDERRIELDVPHLGLSLVYAT
ncbi:cache domain-containing protein [Sinomonas flava]|uniref:cache domain-containing protein n=1 Tax=Sinomonas flava TaxID=496857 RepID=UPI0039A53661